MGDELPAGGMLHRGGDAHFDPELVRLVRFALADALDLWRVQGIDLAAALAALLFQHAPGQEQRPYAMPVIGFLNAGLFRQSVFGRLCRIRGCL
jgi:hypothetical protein